MINNKFILYISIATSYRCTGLIINSTPSLGFPSPQPAGMRSEALGALISTPAIDGANVFLAHPSFSSLKRISLKAESHQPYGASVGALRLLYDILLSRRLDNQAQKARRQGLGSVTGPYSCWRIPKASAQPILKGSTAP